MQSCHMALHLFGGPILPVNYIGHYSFYIICQVGTVTDTYMNYPGFYLTELQKCCFLLVIIGYHNDIKKTHPENFSKSQVYIPSLVVV
jgi:hypothetical protein